MANMLLLLIAGVGFLIQGSGHNIPALIVFGDSSVDTGNNNHIRTLLKSDFRPYGRDFFGGRPTGRFCNGRLATDFIADGLGLGPEVPAYLDTTRTIHDFASAVCFASAGTGLDNATSAVLNVIPLWKELQYFKQYRRKLEQHLGSDASEILSRALYIVSIGTNDFLENYFLFITGRFRQFTVGEFEDFLVCLATNFITEIYSLGARRVMLIGLSPIGCLPLEKSINILDGGKCNERYNKVAKEFNAKVDAMAGRLSAVLPGLWLKVDHIYDLLLGIIRSPSRYGFENADKGCCGTGRFELGYLCNELSTPCQDADKYVFWDSIHPTQRVHQFIANHTLSNTLADLLQ